MKKLKYSPELLGTMPDTRLAVLTDKHPSFIWRERNKRGINVSSVSSPRLGYRTDVFRTMTTETAYWLGFYYADGCICKTTSDRYIVAFSSCDYDVTQKLSKWYGLNEDLIKSRQLLNGKISYRISLCNKELFDSLDELGCTPRKTWTAQQPNISQELYSPFMLGFFDGDGSISLNTTINSWKASMGTASEIFFNWWCDILSQQKRKYSVEKRKIKNGNFHQVTMCGANAKEWLTSVYNSVPQELPMTRKRNKYEQLCFSVKTRS